MENLKEQRLGYCYNNAKGDQMLVVEYNGNKNVVVKNVTAGTIHKCRWCDLKNVRCPAVYDATAARNRFKEELDAASNRFKEELDKVSAINAVTEAEKPAGGANSARTDLSDEVIRQVKESKGWAFADDLRRDYDEGNGGCASVAVASSIVLVVVGLLAWLLW